MLEAKSWCTHSRLDTTVGDACRSLLLAVLLLLLLVCANNAAGCQCLSVAAAARRLIFVAAPLGLVVLAVATVRYFGGACCVALLRGAFAVYYDVPI